MASIIQPFKTILFGLAFSSSLRVNVFEATQIAHFFVTKLVLLNVGEKNAAKEKQIETIYSNILYSKS